MNSSPLIRAIAAAVCLVAGLVPLTSVHADENYFGYTYGSEILPKGESEVYQWATFRSGKGDATYRALDLQTELEHGFADRLQGSLYLNAIQHDISGVSGFADRDQFRFNGVQGSLKYAVRSPYTDGLGVALYLEPGYKRYSRNSGQREDQVFLETKIILQKNYLDNLLVWAANVTAEFERAHNREESTWESELEVELSTGLSYRFAPRWFVGVEGLVTSAFERMHLAELGEYGVFAGPNIHYAAGKWWFTVTALVQMTGWPETNGSRNLANFEKLEVRSKIGLDF